MKNKLIMSAAALLAAAVLMTGCTSGNSGEKETETSASESAAGTSQTIIENIEIPQQQIEAQTSRPLEEGDDYAINKINHRTEGDELPGGYKLRETSIENQGKFYANGKSRIIIRAYNYKEDLQDMAVWADNACAMITLSNFTKACDTVFETPVNTEICGYDAIRYDYQTIQYDFVHDENNPEAEGVKTELFRMNCRGYFFYSGQDAYVIYFETMEDDWDEQIEMGEALIADFEVTETNY